jgi:hypothetical protein
VAAEWRVEVELDDEGHGFGLGERLRALRLDDEARGRLGKRVIVTRDGSRVFLYADSEEATREAERVVRELVARHELRAEVGLTRWDPVEETWKDASEPLPASKEEREAALARKEAVEAEEAREEGRYDWEVHADLDSHDDALRLAERLEAEGHPVTRRWSYVIVGALTEERAGELAEWLRAEAPAGTEVEIVPLLDEPAHPMFVWLGAPRLGASRLGKCSPPHRARRRLDALAAPAMLADALASTALAGLPATPSRSPNHDGIFGGKH